MFVACKIAAYYLDAARWEVEVKTVIELSFTSDHIKCRWVATPVAAARHVGLNEAARKY